MDDRINYCFCDFCDIWITREEFQNQKGLCKSCLNRYEKVKGENKESEGNNE